MRSHVPRRAGGASRGRTGPFAYNKRCVQKPYSFPPSYLEDRGLPEVKRTAGVACLAAAKGDGSPVAKPFWYHEIDARRACRLHRRYHCSFFDSAGRERVSFLCAPAGRILVDQPCVGAAAETQNAARETSVGTNIRFSPIPVGRRAGPFGPSNFPARRIGRSGPPTSLCHRPRSERIVGRSLGAILPRQRDLHGRFGNAEPGGSDDGLLYLPIYPALVRNGRAGSRPRRQALHGHLPLRPVFSLASTAPPLRLRCGHRK